MEDRKEAAQQARDWLAQDPLFLDTETTGVKEKDEVVEVAVVDAKGSLLLQARVKPSVPISDEARAVHGISDADVAPCPTMDELWNYLGLLLKGRMVIAYNSQYDQRMLAQSLRDANTPWITFRGQVTTHPTIDWNNAGPMIALRQAERIVPLLLEAHFECAMKLHARYAGVWGRSGYRWHKLSEAAAQLKVEIPGALHGAAVDAEVTRRLVVAMAKYGEGDIMQASPLPEAHDETTNCEPLAPL